MPSTPPPIFCCWPIGPGRPGRRWPLRRWRGVPPRSSSDRRASEGEASTVLWMIGLSVLSCFVVLFLLGRRDERTIRRDWELLLTPKGENLYRNIEGRVHNELALADLTYDEAFAVRELGSVDEAQKLLDVAYRATEN